MGCWTRVLLHIRYPPGGRGVTVLDIELGQLSGPEGCRVVKSRLRVGRGRVLSGVGVLSRHEVCREGVVPFSPLPLTRCNIPPLPRGFK